MKFLLTLVLYLTLSLYVNAEDSNEAPSLIEATEHIHEQFRPLSDVTRAQLIVQLAEAYGSEHDQMKKIVPYIIQALIKQEVSNLGFAKSGDKSLTAMRKEVIAKLRDQQKAYIEYDNMTKFLLELSDDHKKIHGKAIKPQ